MTSLTLAPELQAKVEADIHLYQKPVSEGTMDRKLLINGVSVRNRVPSEAVEEIYLRLYPEKPNEVLGTSANDETPQAATVSTENTKVTQVATPTPEQQIQTSGINVPSVEPTDEEIINFAISFVVEKSPRPEIKAAIRG